jgi:hypothetical protein
LIQLTSTHRPLPFHRLRGEQLIEPWFILVSAATLLGFIMLCWGLKAALLPSPSTDPALAHSVPVDLRCDREGITGRITNNSGVPLSRVAVVLRVSEKGKSTPIIRGVYHLEPAGGIEQGETVECQVLWRNEHSTAYATARGSLAARAEVCALIGEDGEALYEVLP